MGEQTHISWCHATYNPWRGCAKVSPGCEHCYAEAMSKRNPAVLGEWGPEGKRAFAVGSYSRLPFAWDIAAEKAGVRRRVFCGSLMDAFEDRPELEEARDLLHAQIALTPNLDWLLLTKRPEVAFRYYDEPGLYKRVIEAARSWRNTSRWDRLTRIGISNPTTVLSGYFNRWLGVSVEDQEQAEKRIPWLLKTPAAVRFISAEPLLGPIDPRPWLTPERYLCSGCVGDSSSESPECPGHETAPLSWVITGGESGPRARPCDVNWIGSIVAQCQEAKVPVFVKQDSAPRPGQQGRIPDSIWQLKEFPR